MRQVSAGRACAPAGSTSRPSARIVGEPGDESRRACSRCGGEVERRFRYCPWCAAPQRLKIVEFFASHPLLPSDRGRSLRVSRYLGPREAERHVRFSVWNESHGSAEAAAAVSLDELEAERLA